MERALPPPGTPALTQHAAWRAASARSWRGRRSRVCPGCAWRTSRRCCCSPRRRRSLCPPRPPARWAPRCASAARALAAAPPAPCRRSRAPLTAPPAGLTTWCQRCAMGRGWRMRAVHAPRRARPGPSAPLAHAAPPPSCADVGARAWAGGAGQSGQHLLHEQQPAGGRGSSSLKGPRGPGRRGGKADMRTAADSRALRAPAAPPRPCPAVPGAHAAADAHLSERAVSQGHQQGQPGEPCCAPASF